MKNEVYIFYIQNHYLPNTLQLRSQILLLSLKLRKRNACASFTDFELFSQANKNDREGNLHHLLKYLRIFSPLAPAGWFSQRVWFSWGRILLPLRLGSFHTGMSARQSRFCSGTWCNDDITPVHGCFTSAFNQGPGRTISSLHGIGPFFSMSETVDLFKIQVDWHVLHWWMFKATFRPKMKIPSSFPHPHVVPTCVTFPLPWNTKGGFSLFSI